MNKVLVNVSFSFKTLVLYTPYWCNEIHTAESLVCKTGNHCTLGMPADLGVWVEIVCIAQKSRITIFQL